MSSLPTSALRGKLPLLQIVANEPKISAEEIDQAFPFVPYSDAELAKMEAQFRAEQATPEYPSLEPVTRKCNAINWSLFARPVQVIEVSDNGNWKFLTCEDRHGKRYELHHKLYAVADVKAGDYGFVVPCEAEDVWSYHREIPDAPQEQGDGSDNTIPF